MSFKTAFFTVIDQGKQSDFVANKRKNGEEEEDVLPLTTMINNDVWHMAPVLG